MNLQEFGKLYDFTGKTFVVTGGTGVLGGEVACALTDVNANVVVLDRKAPEGSLVDYVSPRGGWRCKAVKGDVLDRDSLVKAAAVVKQAYGPIYGLVNAAGGNNPKANSGPAQPFFDLPEDALKLVFNLNLVGTILPCQVFGQQMAEAGEGVILNYSSMAAYRPLTNVVAYAAAKAGITNFTSWLAVHLAKNYSGKIRVNAIAPGFFLGEQNRDMLVDKATGSLTARGQAIIDHTPMGRFGNPEDTLGTVLFLLSPASSFVTGIVIPVDGGFSSFSGV